MIDADFITAVAELGHKAHEPHNIKINDDAALVVIDGTLKEVSISPPRRRHTAKDLTAIIAFAKANPGASVWYSVAGATCLTNDADRRDRIDFAPTFSPQLNTLIAWDKSQGNAMKQEAAVKILRTMFRDCLGRAGDLLGVMKSLKFKQGAAGGAEIGHGKASYNKSIENEITGAGSIPEWFTMDVSIFASGFPCVQGVDVAIWIDVPNEVFHFIPIPGAVARAIERAEEKIGEVLGEELGGVGNEGDVRLYYGTP